MATYRAADAPAGSSSYKRTWRRIIGLLNTLEASLLELWCGTAEQL